MRAMPLQPSLLRHLLAWALGSLLAVWAGFAVVGYQTGIHEADELTDGHLASVASLVLAQRTGEFLPSPSAATLLERGELRAHDYQQSLSIVIWDAQGHVLTRTGQAPTPTFAGNEGFETVQLGNPPLQWRSFSKWSHPARDRRVSVILSLAERDELAEDIAEQVAAPGLWLLPVALLVLTLAIRKGLRPLLTLSQQVERLEIINRNATLPGPAHQEFKPVVNAINTLVARYGAALDRERALASEMAHELRTPLASLSLHAASLRDPLAAAERDAALRHIEHDATRAGAVLTHLLSLARASRIELADAACATDLAALARRVTAEYGQAAHSSGHDLSVDAPLHCVAKAHPVLLEVALRNLIDNALAHTPAGTAVQVRVSAGPPTLEVWDDGLVRSRQGLAPATPREPGLGLGHQVVQRIASVHEGRFDTVNALDATAGDGRTCYRLTLGLDGNAGT